MVIIIIIMIFMVIMIMVIIIMMIIMVIIIRVLIIVAIFMVIIIIMMIFIIFFHCGNDHNHHYHHHSVHVMIIIILSTVYITVNALCRSQSPRPSRLAILISARYILICLAVFFIIMSHAGCPHFPYFGQTRPALRRVILWCHWWVLVAMLATWCRHRGIGSSADWCVGR